MSKTGSLPATGVALSGFMGAGKSTVAPTLAARLGLPWWDLDACIERRLGRSIPDIFSTEGEGTFRTAERDTLTAMVGQGPAVAALGGGALLDRRSRELLQQVGWTVVVLSAPWPVLAARIAASDRPLASVARARFDARRAHYAALGLVIDTANLTPDAVAQRIVAALNPGRRTS